MIEILNIFSTNPALLDVFLNVFSFITESSGIIAQAGLDGFVTRILNVFRLVSILFAVIGLIYASFQLNSGDVRSALLGICASGLMGSAYLIVVSLFGEPTGELDLDLIF